MTSAADLSGYAVLTSDYVFRGVTFSDGHFAAQVGADVSFDSGFYAGVWASSIDIERANTSDREWEIDYYAGYTHELSDTFALGANIVVYTFPESVGAIDYEYEEIGLSLNYADRLWFEYNYSPDVFSSNRDTHNFSLFGELPLPQDVILSAGIGRYDVSALAGAGYTYWELGIARSFSDRLELDLRYHDADRWLAPFSVAERVRSRLVVSAKINF